MFYYILLYVQVILTETIQMIPKGDNSTWSMQIPIVSPCLHFGGMFILVRVLKEILQEDQGLL